MGWKLIRNKVKVPITLTSIFFAYLYANNFFNTSCKEFIDRMSVISQVPVTKYMVASEMSKIEHWVIEKFKHEDRSYLDLPFSFIPFL